MNSLQKDSYARTWLIRILINECYAILKRQTRFVSQDQIPDGAAEPWYPGQEDYSDLYRAILELDTKDRLVLILYYFEDYRMKEIGTALDLTEDAVKKRLQRARMKLREELKMEA